LSSPWARVDRRSSRSRRRIHSASTASPTSGLSSFVRARRANTSESALRGRAESPIILGVLAALCAAYFPFLGGGVLTDDFAHLMRQRAWPTLAQVVSTPDPFGFYRPVVQVSFWANVHLFGFEPVAFRAVNLFLHLACIACVYRLALVLALSPLASLLA